MYNKNPFSVDVSDYMDRPLYSFDLESTDCEKEILNFINAQYKNFIEGEISRERRNEQTDNLAAYLGFSDSRPQGTLTDNGPVYRRRAFKRLRTHPIKYLTDNLVSRMIINKPNYRIFTINRNVLEEKKKTRTANKIAKSVFSDPINNDKFKEYIRQAVIFSESFMEVFWNINKGKRVGTKTVELLDSHGYPMLDPEGNPITIKKRLNSGDWDIELWDPRFVITQEADSPDKSEWVILFKYVAVEKERICYPEHADKIQVQDNLDDVETGTLQYRDYKNHTIHYKLYHRPSPEMPDGRIIEGTPTCIYRNTGIPHESLVEKELFPVVQLRTVKIIGTERGSKSIVAQGKALQLAKNNLLNRALHNLITFPPFRVWEDRSMDKDKLREGIPTDMNYRSGGTPPQVVTAHVLTNEELELMDRIDSDLQKIFTVSPVSIGDAMPNMRSGQQMELALEQESKQSFPIEDEIKDSLIKLIQLVFAFVGDEYTAYKQDEYMVRYYGDRNQFMQEPFDPEDLKETFDIRIDTEGKLPDTYAGKVNYLTQLNQILPPGQVSSQWLIDKLELGDTDEALNQMATGIDLARKHISRILEGKDAPSPQKWIDLLPYYEEFMKKFQTPELSDLLENKHYGDYLIKHRNPEKELKGHDLIAFRLLDQVNTIEMLLVEAMQQQDARGIIDPATQQPPLRYAVYVKFPSFPTIYEPDSKAPIDPILEADTAIANPMDLEINAGGMGPSQLPAPSGQKPPQNTTIPPAQPQKP